MSNANWPWTWEDSAQTGYLREDSIHFEAIQHSGHSPRRVLMLGCGDGTSLNAMARRNPGCEFVGVDMNADYIDKATSQAPANTEYARCLFHNLGDDYGKFDTVLMVGVVGCISYLDFVSAIVTAGSHATNDVRFAFNFPNKMIFAERMIYRDAIESCGRNKEAALRAVKLIATKHPSDTLREYGRLILDNRHHDQEHFLFAPEFQPYYEWDVKKTLGRYDFSLLQSSASPFALGDTPIEIIRNSSRWHIYGRKQVHNHRH